MPSIPPQSYGIIEYFGFEPLWPFNLTVFESSGNSTHSPPKPAKRTRHDNPSQYSGQPWTTRYGAQRGRLWLHKSSDAPYEGLEPGPNATGSFIHLKTGFFARHNRDHTGDSISDRFGNLYGFGECRAKELNGQISMGNPAFAITPQTGENVIGTSTNAAGCNIAELDDAANYRPCPFSFTEIEFRVGQDSSGVIWKSFVRMPLDIPQGATIVEAKLTLYFGFVGDSFDATISVMDVDDVDDVSSTAATTHALWSNSVDVTLAPLEGNGAAYILPQSFKEQVQRVVNRAGFSEGNHIGFEIEPVAGLSNGQVHSLAFEQSNPNVALSIAYRDSTYTGGAPSLPPSLRGYQRLYTTRVYDKNPGPEMNETLGGGVKANEIYDHINEARNGAAYKFMVFTPVPDITSWYDDAIHGPTPPLYDENAHNSPYPFNQIGTYEVPCERRKSTPWRYGSLNRDDASVSRGLRAAVAHAHKPPKPAIEPIYNTGCDGSEGVTFGLQESLIHQYEGVTETVRYYYAHPVSDWWIEYTGYIKGWLVYGDELDFLRMPWGSSPDDHGPFIHWNCWWEMIVEAKYNGPPRTKSDWTIFNSWVNSLDNKWGAEVQPKTQDQCNDLLWRCAQVPCALGDTLRPTQSVQENDCEGDAILDPGRQLPCVEKGDLSYWYLPTISSNHPVTPTAGPVVPLLPEYGLWHQFERKRYTHVDKTSSTTDEGWLALHFQTNHPFIRGEAAINTFPRNRIERWVPFDPINSETLTAGFFAISWTDTDGVMGVPGDYLTSGSISNGDTAAQAETALEAAFGVGNVSVTKPSESPETFDVEFTGDLAAQNAFSFSIEVSTYTILPEDEFSFNRTEVQSGKPGGVVE